MEDKEFMSLLSFGDEEQPDDDQDEAEEPGARMLKIHPGGAPTRFKSEMVEQVYKLTLLGLTEERIAKFLGISVDTLIIWKSEKPEFLEAIKEGKEVADGNVAVSMYQRACGYEHEVEESKVVSCGAGMGSQIEKVTVRRHVPADVEAAKFWLTNRHKKLWRYKIETGVTDTEGNDVPQAMDLSRLSSDELLQLFALQKKASGE